MPGERGLPAKDRPGKLGWLGPISLCVGLVSWVSPGGGAFLAVSAIVCGVVSIWTKGQYRVDGTAVAGTCVAGLQLIFSTVLLAMELSGY